VTRSAERERDAERRDLVSRGHQEGRPGSRGDDVELPVAVTVTALPRRDQFG
jgi:hypothetical protein